MDEERRKRMKEAMNRPEVKEKNRLGAIRQHTKMTEEQKEEYSRNSIGKVA